MRSLWLEVDKVHLCRYTTRVLLWSIIASVEQRWVKRSRFDHPVLRVSPSATWDDLCHPQGMELAERYPRQPVEGS